MKNPENMPKKELVRIIRAIRDWLWLSEDEPEDIKKIYGENLVKKLQKEQPEKEQFLEYYDPDKNWDDDTLSGIAEIMTNAGFNPTGAAPVKTGYPDRTPDQRWKDDEIQFARLLDELQGIGFLNLMKEAEWQALESSMDLPRTRIMELFGRAHKRWDAAKKEIGVGHGTKS